MIEKYNEIVTEIVKQFYERYVREIYDEVQEEGDFEYYVDIFDYRGVLGDPINIGDYYFPLNDILIAEANEIPCKVFQDYYDKSLELAMEEKKMDCNLYNYWKIGL